MSVWVGTVLLIIQITSDSCWSVLQHTISSKYTSLLAATSLLVSGGERCWWIASGFSFCSRKQLGAVRCLLYPACTFYPSLVAFNFVLSYIYIPTACGSLSVNFLSSSAPAIDFAKLHGSFPSSYHSVRSPLAIALLPAVGLSCTTCTARLFLVFTLSVSFSFSLYLFLSCSQLRSCYH